MSSDPTLEALIAGGHRAIAADRYEEQTGDAELATLMRIDGLEWELVGGVPSLKMTTELTNIDDGRFVWWSLRCGTFDFGTASYEPLDGVTLPDPLTETPIPAILASVGMRWRFQDRFYTLYKEAIARVCTRYHVAV